MDSTSNLCSSRFFGLVLDRYHHRHNSRHGRCRVILSGTGNDAMQWIAERFLKTKSKVEEKALEEVGVRKA